MSLARLVVIEGPDAGREFELPLRGGGVGRGEGNLVQLTDPTVSRVARPDRAARWRARVDRRQRQAAHVDQRRAADRAPTRSRRRDRARCDEDGVPAGRGRRRHQGVEPRHDGGLERAAVRADRSRRSPRAATSPRSPSSAIACAPKPPPVAMRSRAPPAMPRAPRSKPIARSCCRPAAARTRRRRGRARRDGAAPDPAGADREGAAAAVSSPPRPAVAAR